MARPRLHLDADASRKDLFNALISQGHNVTRTPAPGLALDANDEFHLLLASAHDRFLFTINIGDFIQPARRMPEHKGILLANQQSHSLKELITLLDHALAQTEAENWIGQVRWLSDWRGATSQLSIIRCVEIALFGPACRPDQLHQQSLAESPASVHQHTVYLAGKSVPYESICF